MLLGSAFVSTLAAGLIAAVFPPVSVTVAPDLPCPTAEAVTRAIAAMRGADPVAAGAPFQLGLAASGDAIRAELADATGAVSWERTFAAGPSECDSVADAVALIVERHFREMAWTPAAPEDGAAEPVVPTPTPPRRALSPASVVAAPATVPAAAPSFSAVSRLTIAAGPAYWTRTNGLAVALDATARVGDGLRAGLGVLLPPAHATSNLGAGGGQVAVTAVPLLASFALERATSARLSLHAAVEGLLTFERGETQSIAAPAAAWRSIFAAGVGAGGTLALGERLRLDLRLAGYRTLLGRSYTVQGVAGNVLDPPPWQAIVGLGLGWVFVK